MSQVVSGSQCRVCPEFRGSGVEWGAPISAHWSVIPVRAAMTDVVVKTLCDTFEGGSPLVQPATNQPGVRQ